MYKDTVTLYCRKHEATGDLWYPTVLEGVDLNTDKAALVALYGETCQDSAKLHIKYDIVNASINIAGKVWHPQKEWASLPNEELEKAIAFQTGENFGFFVTGAQNTEVVNDEDYTEGFYDYMNKKYDGVYAITTVGGPYSVIQHFEILGK